MEIPREGLHLTRVNFQAVGEAIYQGLQAGEQYRLKLEPFKPQRSLSQNALLHVWCSELSDWLKSKGRADASPEFCKDLMKYTFLGFEETTYTDGITGNKQTVQTLRHTSKLKTGEMFDFMTRVQAWAADLGCLLRVPENSEFMKNKLKQDH